ncbi:MAG: cadmium-translocating P-type ATPase [Planctomycetes bacterium]|nr:cadmium-translocating P-type ATPase [Planctomycetota bacterium]
MPENACKDACCAEIHPLKTSTFYIKNMDCNDEARVIQKILDGIKGVREFQFNILQRKVTVRHSTDEIAIVNALVKNGFPVSMPSGLSQKLSFIDRHHYFLHSAISGILLLAAILLHYKDPSNEIIMPFLLLSVCLGGIHIAYKGIVAVKMLSFDINFLMTTAVIGAFFIGDYFEAATVIFLFTLAQFFESAAIERANRTIHSLLKLSPDSAVLLRDGKEAIIAVADIKINDALIVKPGEKIPIDGIVAEGITDVNQASITGESLPIEKTKGSVVYAGTINLGGSIIISASCKPEDTTISRIIELIEKAQAQKAPSEIFIQKFARYYTPMVLLAALLITLIPVLLFQQPFSPWFYKALVLLVIACPCALVISTPVSIISALTCAAKNGIIIKGGQYLEQLSAVKVIAFDKTGTLTRGKLSVQGIRTFGIAEEELLRIAGSLEIKSEHAIAEPIIQKMKDACIKPYDTAEFHIIPGRGVKGIIGNELYYAGNHNFCEELGICDKTVHEMIVSRTGLANTVVLVGNAGKVLGLIELSDKIRPEAVKSLMEISGIGRYKTVMLTGDNCASAKKIADVLKIDEFHAELLPQQKVELIKKFSENSGPTAMIGDGINDAPSLASANVGITMGASGSDTALEAANIALLSDDLTRIPFLLRLSKRTLNNIKQNVAFAIGTKAIFAVLAVSGVATLWMAVFADMGASIIVIFNALRLLNFKDGR